MQTKNISPPDLRPIRAEAGEILASNGNRLLLIEALLVLLTTLMPYYLLQTVYAVFAEKASVPATVLFVCALLLLTLLFVLPLALGLWRMAEDMVRGERSSLDRLFSSFASAKSYRRALRLSFGFLWRASLILSVAALTCLVTACFFSGNLLAGLLCGLLVFAELVIGVCICLRSFSVLARGLCEKLSLSDAREAAKRFSGRAPLIGAFFFLSFVPQLLLGALTFGIFLIWEVLPRMCLCYFLYCRKQNEIDDPIGGI